MYFLRCKVVITFTKITIILKIAQSALFLGLAPFPVMCCVGRDSLRGNNSENNGGPTKHACNGSEASLWLQ